MEELKRMVKEAYVSVMQGKCRWIMEQIAESVNNAPTGNVISGSEMQVRDLAERLGRIAFETAVQMRVDSHESAFSPSEGCGGEGPTKQGTVQPQRNDGERSDQVVATAVVGRGGGKRLSGGPSAR